MRAEKPIFKMNKIFTEHTGILLGILAIILGAIVIWYFVSVTNTVSVSLNSSLSSPTQAQSNGGSFRLDDAKAILKSRGVQ